MLFVAALLLYTIHAKYLDSIERLHEMVSSEFVHKSTNFSFLPFTWSERAGLYKSNIHFNFIGSEIETNLRRTFRIPDSNTFVTNFVLISFLEMYELLPSIEVDKERLVTSLGGINWFQDKMYKEGTPIYRFWPTMEKDGVWMSYPVNLYEPMQYFPDAVSFLDFLSKLLHLKGFEKWIDTLGQIFEHIVFAFKIPADIDDSFCNLALGGILAKLSGSFPEANKFFESNNKYYETLFKTMDDLTWKPFLQEKSDVRKIDPRTYMFCSSFLDEVSETVSTPNNEPTTSYESLLRELKDENGLPKVSLPGTWLLSENDTRRYYGKESMPFNVNNIDANVITNFLFGMTYFLLYHPEASRIVTPELENTYLSTAAYIVWAVKSSRIIERPDIGLTYYPSLYDFHWFISRITFLLHNFNGTFPFSSMNTVRDTFIELTRNEVTQMILSEANTSHVGYLYWDDFLGDSDPSDILGEDRLFSTGLAVNAMLDTWTEIDKVEEHEQRKRKDRNVDKNVKKVKRKWVDGTTQKIKDSVLMGLEFLNDFIFGEGALVQNAFFSGSTRSEMTLPFFYPANYYNYVNGSDLPSKNWPPENPEWLTDDLIISMDGYIPKDEYAEWIHKKFFGFKPPLEDTGYNSNFPFWSSPALTYSIAMVAMAKYDNVEAS